MSKKLKGIAAILAATSLALAGCSTPDRGGDSNNGSGNNNASSNTNGGGGKGEVSVMWNQPMYSLNNGTITNNAVANANIVYLMNDSFTYYDNELKLVPNKSMGTYEKVSDSPLTIKMTLADTAKWSDGTPVTATDLLLDYAARSGKYNNAKPGGGDSDDGKKTKGTNVYFDQDDSALDLMPKTPTVSEDGKSITVVYDKPFADWEKSLLGPNIPAHIVGKRALGEADATKATKAVQDAILKDDKAALAKIANSWNYDWNMTKMPSDKDLLVHSGPMKMTDFKENTYVTLEKDDAYKGEHQPKVNKIVVRYNEDPTAAVQALQNDEVQIINPQSTADILKSVKALGSAVKYTTSNGGTYEHVDLAENNKGPFDPASYGGDANKAKLVRQAFLKVIPRQEIIEKIIKPLNPAAEVRNSFIAVPGAPNYDKIASSNGMNTMYGKADIDAAKKLLAEAGVSSPKVRFLFAKGNARREAEYKLIEANAKQAGFNIINSSNAEWSKMLSNTSTYDAALFGWQSASTAVTESQANFVKGGGNNYYGYDNQKVNDLYGQLQVTADEAKQNEILEQIEKLLVDDAFGVTIFQFPEIVANSSAVQNVKPLALSPSVFWNFWEWTIQ